MKKMAQCKNLCGAVLVLLTGCQIHKPVPVEHLPSGTADSGRYNTVYDARQHQQQPARGTVAAGQRPVSTNTQWTPIDIVPLDNAPSGPTQPLTQYEFKPRPQTQKTSSVSTRPVSAQSGYSGTSGYHIVRRGESLYGIAKAYNLSVQTLASYNQLQQPYEIYPNQKLYLNNQGLGGAGTTPVAAAPGYTTPSPVTSSPQPVTSGSIQWNWPAQGTLIGQFASGISNGIQIAGEPGQPVRASADGVVLYSGNEVTGYGELVIIDHGQGYMSTYAHNRRVLVQQGASIKRGAKIAEMGSSEADRTKLHFEIRKDEKPVDPLAYLPQR